MSMKTIRNFLLTICFSLIFCSFCMAMEQIDSESQLHYKVKWIPVNIDRKGFDFHKDSAARLARNKARLGLEGTSNLAIVGISVHNPDNSKSIYVAFPHLVYSTYDTLEDTPSLDDTRVSFMSIADMMRADIAEGKTRAHRISDFISHLFLFSYTRDWGLYAGIRKCSEIIGRGKPEEMSRIPVHPSIASVLHSEQVFLYRTLISEGIFNFMIGDLFKKSDIIELLQLPGSYITFDILTYNDMCPKCFSTCYHMASTLAANINKSLIYHAKMIGAFASIFDSRGGKPFDVNILVSSFRPYQTSRRTTGEGYYLYSKAIPANTVIERAAVEKVSQFFNPWIAQHVFNYEFNNFVRSIESLKPLESVNAYTVNSLLLTFRSLLENKEIESQNIEDISTVFLRHKAVISRRLDSSFIMLPLAIELSRISPQKDPFLEFINLTLDAFGEAKISHTDIPAIIEIQDNQTAILNTAILLQDSVPDRFRHYDFDTMTATAERIILTNVHPIISSFITLKANEIYGKIKHIRLSARLKNALRGLGVTL